MSVQSPKLLKRKEKRAKLKVKHKKRGKIKQIIPSSPKQQRMPKYRKIKYPVEPRTETEKCKLCGEDMLVSKGQVAKYHKECRKKRNSKQFRDKIKKGRKLIKRKKSMPRRGAGLKRTRTMSEETNTPAEGQETAATPESTPETPAAETPATPAE